MISPLSIATDGYLNAAGAIGVNGYTGYLFQSNYGGLRFYPAVERLSAKQIEQIKREDEELIALVSIIGEIFL